jgi:hypothetical protein
MTRITRPLAIAVIATLAATALFAADRTMPRTDQINWKAAEKNYVLALQTGNDGSKISAARLMADYRLKGGAEALITSLKTDPSEAVRMSAALALVMLDVKEGRDAVADAALYDGSDRVAKFCDALLEARTTNGPTLARE